MRWVTGLVLFTTLIWAEPLWIKNPTNDGKVIAVVGVAEAHYPKHVQERVALMRAKAEISDIINIKIGTEFTTREKREGEKGESNASSSSHLHSSSAIKIQVKEQYRDADGVLYLLVIAN